MTDAFRSLTMTLMDWPIVDGVLREIGRFEPCSMCEKDRRLGVRDEAAEYTNVHYGGEPTCLHHAKQLPELHRKAGYVQAVLARRRKDAKPSEVLDHDFVWEEDDDA